MEKINVPAENSLDSMEGVALDKEPREPFPSVDRTIKELSNYNHNFSASGIFAKAFGELGFPRDEAISVDEKRTEFIEKKKQIEDTLNRIGINTETVEREIDWSEEGILSDDVPNYPETDGRPFDVNRLRKSESASKIFIGIQNLEGFLSYLSYIKENISVARLKEMADLTNFISGQILSNIDSPTDSTLSLLVNLEAVLTKFKDIDSFSEEIKFGYSIQKLEWIVKAKKGRFLDALVKLQSKGLLSDILQKKSPTIEETQKEILPQYVSPQAAALYGYEVLLKEKLEAQVSYDSTIQLIEEIEKMPNAEDLAKRLRDTNRQEIEQKKIATQQLLEKPDGTEIVRYRLRTREGYFTHEINKKDRDLLIKYLEKLNSLKI